MSDFETNKIYLGDCLDTMRKWPDGFVHCCVTSPPYYNLRNYQAEGQIGLEDTPEAYVARLVQVFREVKRILRDDATLWLNLGDSYCNTDKWGGGGNIGKNTIAPDGSVPSWTADRQKRPAIPGIKPKDLIGIPWMVAFALRADGWYLRSDIIWAKKNCMPESVTDRPTKAHEYLFLLAKSDKYFYDAEAIKEQVAESSIARVAQNDGNPVLNTDRKRGSTQGEQTLDIAAMVPADGRRNKRSVWHVATQPFKEAHFATFPPDLISPCIQAGTSEKGVCARCGASYERDVERVVATSKECPKTQDAHEARGGIGKPVGTVGKSGSGRIDGYTKTLGWRETCKCRADVAKAIVLDPFMGAGTTALVAATHGRRFIGCELNPEYKAIADKRIANEVAQEKLL